VQVTWDAPSDRHLEAIAEFQQEHPNAGEGVVVTAESYERGMVELEGE
jgi:hypothetical protein